MYDFILFVQRKKNLAKKQKKRREILGKFKKKFQVEAPQSKIISLTMSENKKNEEVWLTQTSQIETQKKFRVKLYWRENKEAELTEVIDGSQFKLRSTLESEQEVQERRGKKRKKKESLSQQLFNKLIMKIDGDSVDYTPTARVSYTQNNKRNQCKIYRFECSFKKKYSDEYSSNIKNKSRKKRVKHMIGIYIISITIFNTF